MVSSGSPRQPRSRLTRVLLVALACLACLLLAGALVVRHVLLASLPTLDGTQKLAGLSAAVVVERDALGVPTVRGANRLDVARATGFVHAQDRFFQMDMARRYAAGELSELFGRGALGTDRKLRLHRLRRVAHGVLARALPEQRALLQAYADGVNAGLEALGARPPEYLLLRTSPAPWRPQDSILMVGAMLGNDLANSDREVELARMYARLPAALVDFLRPLGDEWDAPMLGDPIEPPPQGDMELAAIRARYGSQMVLFGNLEASDIENLPAAEFRIKVERALREGTAGSGRGFVLMPSACPYGRVLSPAALRNYQVMVETIERG